MGVVVAVIVMIVIALVLLVPWLLVRHRRARQGDGKADPQGNWNIYGGHG
jgi:uncharacterized membrane protein YhaH (DUF805 family)